MKHLGDITKINGCEVLAVEVIIGGSPCQDLSVAGKRAGLQGERSGLFMEQIRIIKEMRENDRRNLRADHHVRPRYMVWENVPGAFSSAKGEDFRAVLEETARIVEENAVIPRPADGKWTTAGCIMGDGWSVAWRVLDAQFWGVPQRRRRIALVADFGGSTAPEILFERESLSGDSQESGAQGEGTAGDAMACVSESVDRVKCLTPWDCQSKRVFDPSGTMSTYQAMGDGGGNNVAICIQGNCIDRADTAGCNGKGWRDDDVSFTLNTIDRPAVYDGRENGDGMTAPTLTGDHQNRVTDYTALTFQNTGRGWWNESPVGTTIRTPSGGDSTLANIVCAVDCRNITENPNTNSTLQAKSNGGMSLNLQNTVRVQNLVRRLTPLECERLQGFPDGWTDIGEWVDSKGRIRQTSDSARYKALGNSIALPPWRFVLSRMQPYLVEHTMASLFDGISGFVLIWAELNGADKVKWTSEIEEFPISVCKRHFGDDETGK